MSRMSAFALLLLCCSCADEGGSFSFLTYNVAGLPQGLNDDQFPEQNIPQMGPKLNAYDVVVVQEDFAYSFELRERLELPYQSYPKEIESRLMNDGLNTFSRFPFPLELERALWTSCHGTTDSSSDCLAEKGFSFAPLSVAEGVTVNVVDLHMDAGGGDEDHAARVAQLDQLLTFVASRADDAWIIAGDTNLSYDVGEDDPDEALLAQFISDSGFTDACSATSCPDVDRIDRVFIRSGVTVDLSFSSWSLAAEMVDANGSPLSDHEAVAVGIDWTRPSR